MTEEPELAELTRSALDAETLQALLEDLTSLTDILEVTTKGAELQRADKTTLTLWQAVEALQAGELRGVQVRYHWRGEEWLDTLLRVPGGTRIVRIKAEPG